LAILEDPLTLDKFKPRTTFLKLCPLLCPFFATVVFIHQELLFLAEEIFLSLLQACLPFEISFEKKCSRAGKSYHRQDEIGTYF
jgi:glycyl-tRNA synthetase (class II)